MTPRSRSRYPFLSVFLSFTFFAGPATLCLAGSYTLPDTGQTQCYDRSVEISCPNAGEAYYGQDGNYQVTPPAYAMSQNGLVVTDLNTGLMWQRADDGLKRDWYDANDYCEGLALDGQSDWRLPSEMELVSIVDYGRYNPAIDPIFSTHADDYWSATIHAVNLGRAWYVGFSTGYMAYHDRENDKYYVRCVRGETLSYGPFTDNGDGTLTDAATGLMWQQADAGSLMRWPEAISTCDALDLAGYADWRLPNVRELESTVDHSVSDPAIDSAFSSRSDYYWSGSTDASSVPDGWAVTFGQGWSNSVKKDGRAAVRCVRGGKIPVPQSQQVFVVPATVEPVLSVDPAQAKPVGVGDVATAGSVVGPVGEEGSTVSLHVALEAFSGSVDIYLAVYMPDVDPVNILILGPDNRFQSHLDGVVPWQEDTTGPIDEKPLGDIQTTSLPSGTYEIYLGVTPSGKDFSGPYYLWKTGFRINP